MNSFSTQHQLLLIILPPVTLKQEKGAVPFYSGVRRPHAVQKMRQIRPTALHLVKKRI